jgi:hypothetical protein
MDDWQSLTKAEKKERLEAAFVDALDEFERADREPNEWESEHLFRAIHAAIDGLLDGAAQHLELTYEEEAKISPDWRPTEGLGNFTVKQLRTELDRFRYWPVQKPPIFMR